MQNLIPSLRAADNAKKCGWPTRPESMKFCSGSFSILAGGDFALLYARARARLGADLCRWSPPSVQTGSESLPT
jgi:hypothetical protein